jgi:hypothetical protein
MVSTTRSLRDRCVLVAKSSAAPEPPESDEFQNAQLMLLTPLLLQWAVGSGQWAVGSGFCPSWFCRSWLCPSWSCRSSSCPKSSCQQSRHADRNLRRLRPSAFFRPRIIRVHRCHPWFLRYGPRAGSKLIKVPTRRYFSNSSRSSGLIAPLRLRSANSSIRVTARCVNFQERTDWAISGGRSKTCHHMPFHDWLSQRKVKR